MSRYRYAAGGKRDANEEPIVDLLRRAGCSVARLSGEGIPDLLVGIKGVTFLIEVKDGSKPKPQRRLTPAQQKWHLAWRGGPIYIVEALEQVGTVLALALKSEPHSM